MKQFNLKEYLENPSRKVVTRDGKNVRIICTDRESTYYPIIALVKMECGEENAAYTKNGKYYLDDTNNNDLFFVTEKHEGWINLLRDDDGRCYIGDSRIFKLKGKAEEMGKAYYNYIATVKIEWEE